MQISKKWDLSLFGKSCMQCSLQSADLTFLIDASSSIDDEEWHYVQKFMMKMATLLPVGLKQSQSRIGIVFFHKRTLVYDYMKVNEYMAAYSERDYAMKQLFRSYYKNGYGTYTHNGIDSARDLILRGRGTR